MKLYYFETLNPRKACAVARYLGSPVEFVRIDLAKGENRTPEFLAINPNGKVPTLVDGNTVIWESNTILRYLAGKQGNATLYPTDLAARTEVERLCQVGDLLLVWILDVDPHEIIMLRTDELRGRVEAQRVGFGLPGLELIRLEHAANATAGSIPSRDGR